MYGVSFVCFSLSSALMRERDELAAALEVRERIKYDLATPEREEVLSTGDLIIEVTDETDYSLSVVDKNQ